MQEDTTIADVDVTINNAVNTSSPVIAVATDLPFHYFITNEQAKSILALQELLQNEVSALLEFRDVVIEEFPQLAPKIPPFNSALQSQTVLSPSKWEPGIRVKRKLGQQLRDQDILVPSLLPRYRSNSQGKASRNGDTSSSTTSNSAIQDSGFCTESSKDHSSAISSRSKSRDTDELWSLLDVIHNKGARYKLEIEYLRNKLNHKSSSISDFYSKRRCKSLNDLIGCNSSNFTFECAMKTEYLVNELNSLKRERDLLLKKLRDIESEHDANLAQTNRLLVELENVTSEKDDIEKRLQRAISCKSEINDEMNDLNHNFLVQDQCRNPQTPFVKCQLLKLSQFFKENSNQNRTNLPNNYLDAKNDVSCEKKYFHDNKNTQQHLKNFSSFDTMDCNDKIIRSSTPNMKESTDDTNTVSSLTEVDNHKSVFKEFDPKKIESKNKDCDDFCNNAIVIKNNNCGDVKAPVISSTETTTVTNAMLASGTISNAHTMTALNKEPCITNSSDKEDILIDLLNGGHLSSSNVPCKNSIEVTLSKDKVLSIVNERNLIALQRHALSLSYYVEALNAYIKRLSKSKQNLYHQLNKYKTENDDLKFQIEEKNIQLEGTKAKVRVLERIRNEKLSYSTSDLMTDFPKTDSQSSHDTQNDQISQNYTICPVSDTALLSEKTAMTLNRNVSKCVNKDQSDSRRKGASCRHNISKIPLKIFSRHPVKLSSNSNNKKISASLKECPTSESTNDGILSSIYSYIHNNK